MALLLSLSMSRCLREFAELFEKACVGLGFKIYYSRLLKTLNCMSGHAAAAAN